MTKFSLTEEELRIMESHFVTPSNNSDLRIKIEKMEEKYDYSFKVVLEAITQLLDAPKKPKKKIGFQVSKL